jgi:hypothetical protein
MLAHGFFGDCKGGIAFHRGPESLWQAGYAVAPYLDLAQVQEDTLSGVWFALYDMWAVG